MKQRKLSIGLCVIYLLVLGCVILLKFPFKFANLNDARAIVLIPFYVSEVKSEAVYLNNIFYNVLLFIPFGVFISLIKPDWKFVKKIIPIALLSLSFEILQYIFAIGISDITDVITNTVGGIMGIGLYLILQKIFKEKTHGIINAIALVLFTIILILFVLVFMFLKH